MHIYNILCLFAALQGVSCIQFFLHRSNIACTVNYLDNISDPVANRVCRTIDNNAIITYEYQLTTKEIYDLLDSKIVYTLKKSTFKIPEEIINTFTTEYNFGNILDFTVDKLHNKVYISMEKIMSGSIMNTTNEIPLDDVLTIEEVAQVTTRRPALFEAVKVDPYRRFLFVMVSGYSTSGDRLCRVHRSNLSGKELKLIFTKPRTVEFCRFVVDVNDMRLFVSIKDVLYIFNYEGEMIREVRLPYSITDFAVFENYVYITTTQVNVINKFSLIQTDAPISDTAVYHHDLREDFRIELLDARVQRRKEDGKYVCDRTDCPELCDVDSSGDQCVCFKTKAKTVDGIRCYTCGQSNLTSLVQLPTIVNGHISYPGEFPWHAILYNATNRDLICGGTLISSRVVLTAAHCVTTTCFACTPPVVEAGGLKVALGKTNRLWNITDPYETRRGVRRILVRDTYLGPSTNFANDIALLFLDSEVSVNSHVMPACLDYNLNQLPYHETLTGYVCGFGFTKECGRSCSNYSDTLLHTTGTVINTDDCLVALNLRDLSTFHSLTSDKFCIGNGTVSVVQSGDSGGGFTLAYRGLHYVTGVVSVKLLRYRGRMAKYSFGGFTNISVHMEWIKPNLIDEN